MGKLSLGGIDKNVLRDMLNEAMELQGQEMILTPVLSIERNTVGDPTYRYDEENKQEIALKFENDPQFRTYNRYGIIIDELDADAQVAVIVPKVEGVSRFITEGALLDFKDIQSEGTVNRRYFIGKVLTSDAASVWYVVSVSPYRQQVLINQDTNDKTNEYTNVSGSLVKNPFKG